MVNTGKYCDLVYATTAKEIIATMKDIVQERDKYLNISYPKRNTTATLAKEKKILMHDVYQIPVNTRTTPLYHYISFFLNLSKKILLKFV